MFRGLVPFRLIFVYAEFNSIGSCIKRCFGMGKHRLCSSSEDAPTVLVSVLLFMMGDFT